MAVAPDPPAAMRPLPRPAGLPAVLACLQATLVAGCFFWEEDHCIITEEMCGHDAIIHSEPEESGCNKFIFHINFADSECAPKHATNYTLEYYRECFWDEVIAHLGGHEECWSMCDATHKDDSDKMKLCDDHCLHLHKCFSKCQKPEYKYRDGIESCLSDCSEEAPMIQKETCRGKCGSHSRKYLHDAHDGGPCWCDPSCVYTNDCCHDYENWCQAMGAETFPLPNQSFPLPSLNVTQQTLNVKKHVEEHREIAPAEIGINETEHPAAIAPPAKFDWNSSKEEKEEVIEEQVQAEVAGLGINMVAQPGDVVTPDDIPPDDIPTNASVEEESTSEGADEDEDALVEVRARRALRAGRPASNGPRAAASLRPLRLHLRPHQ